MKLMGGVIYPSRLEHARALVLVEAEETEPGEIRPRVLRFLRVLDRSVIVLPAQDGLGKAPLNGARRLRGCP